MRWCSIFRRRPRNTRRSPASRSATSSPSTACASRSRTAPGAWYAPPPTSPSWWWWWKARCQRRACATCFGPSTACCASTRKSANITRRSEALARRRGSAAGRSRRHRLLRATGASHGAASLRRNVAIVDPLLVRRLVGQPLLRGLGRLGQGDTAGGQDDQGKRQNTNMHDTLQPCTYAGSPRRATRFPPATGKRSPVALVGGAERVRRVDAEDLEVAGKEGELLERQLEAGVLRVALDVGVELRGEEIALDHVALELRHVDAVGGEAAERLVERGRDVAHLEHERRDDEPVAGVDELVLARQHDEARSGVRLVLDVLGQDVEAVDLGGEPRRDRRPGLGAALGHLARRASRVGADHRPHPELAQEIAALAERHDVAFDRLDVAQPRAAGRHQLIADGQEPFGDDMQARRRHQVVDVGDAAGDRVLDRDHAEVRLAGGDHRQRVFEGRTRHRLAARIGLASGDVRIGARLALKHDLLRLTHARPVTTDSAGAATRIPLVLNALASQPSTRAPCIRPTWAPRAPGSSLPQPTQWPMQGCSYRLPPYDGDRSVRAFSNSCGVSTPSGTEATMATSIRMPASKARSCSSRSRRSRGDGGSVTKRSSAARR